MQKRILDHFILHFKDNSNLMLDIKDGSISCRGRIMEITNNTAIYIGKDEKYIQIGIPIHIFNKIKDNQIFHAMCESLRKIETSERSVLSYLSNPCHINKEIDEDKLSKILELKH